MITLNESLVDYIFISRCVPLPLSALKIINNRISFEEVLEFTPNQFKNLLLNLKSVDNLPLREIQQKVTNFVEKRTKKTFSDIEKSLKVCENNNIQCLSFFDTNYPKILRSIDNPPKLIFIQGTIKSEDYKGVAIIGTRNPTKYGIKMAQNIAQKLVKSNFTIISGFARGIDTIAIKSALENGGRAIGVIASGILNIYPKENQSLVEKLISNGALLSERFPNENVTKRALQIRNRITSGLGLGNIFVEGNERSGTRWQYRFGEKQGRLAFAVEPLDHSLEQAFIPNWIINEKGGAKISSIEDLNWVIELLNNEYEKRKIKRYNRNPLSQQRSILKY